MNALRRLCPMLLVLGFGLPSAAQTSSLSERVDLTGTPQTVGSKGTVLRVSESQGEPLATSGPTSLQDSLKGTLPTSRRSMLWAVHRSGVGVGFGVEQRDSLNRSGGVNQPQRTGAMLMGVSVDTGERSQLFVQTPLLNEDAYNPARARLGEVPPGPDAMSQQRQVRMGLVFNTKSQVADLRKGLRMELSGQTTLTLKPRGGRVGVAFQKTW